MKVGLVLGAGGVTGAAWLIGALDALAEEAGWDPAGAHVVVGTSAGAAIAGLVAGGGLRPGFLVAHAAGEVVHPDWDAERSPGASYRPHLALPGIGPGSWRLALGSLVRADRHPAGAVLAGWLPTGLISTEPLRRLVRSVVPAGWGAHPRLHVMACDYATGRRVAFGREDAPPAELADAVAASCAIPGFYRPVEIGRRRYVDGGVCSLSNLDVVAGEGLDLVLCLNPASSRAPGGGPRAALRAAAGRRLGREARKVRAAGAEVVLVQPTADDLAIMGPNPMSRRRRYEIIATARRTTAAQLRHGAECAALRELSAPPDDVAPLRRRAA
ncbi:MAG TPA: patatin-like phospholipase family protein [Solirubrobacteraceae bacterium]